MTPYLSETAVRPAIFPAEMLMSVSNHSSRLDGAISETPEAKLTARQP
jgi:hypothetical protein